MSMTDTSGKVNYFTEFYTLSLARATSRQPIATWGRLPMQQHLQQQQHQSMGGC